MPADLLSTAWKALSEYSKVGGFQIIDSNRNQIFA